MTDFFNWLNQNSTAANLFVWLLGAIIVSVILMYLVAFFQGREISFYPPKIGEKTNKSLKNVGKGHSSLLSYGYPADLSDEFHKAKRISMEGVLLSNTIIRYSMEFTKILNQGGTLRFLMSTPTPEVIAMQSFRSSNDGPSVNNPDYFKATSQNTLLSIRAIGEQSLHPERLEVRMMPYIAPYSLTIIEGDDGVTRAYVRIHSFRTQASKQPTFLVQSGVDDDWLKFFDTQFEQFWMSAERVL